MGWSSDFIAALNSSSIVPIYELEILSLPNSFDGGCTFFSGSGAARIAENSPRVFGTRVIPGRWNVSFGGFSVDLVGDLRPYSPKLSKGVYAVLRCSIKTSSASTPYEVIGYGQLYSISGGRQTWTLEFRDLLSAFQCSSSNKTTGSSHSTSTTRPEYRMFTNAGRAAYLTGNWNSTDSFLDVDDVTYFERESANNGYVKCENLAQSKTFFLEWASSAVTSAPAGRITLASVVARYPSPDAATTLSTGITNNKITNCVRLVGTPWRIMAKILQSTGSNNPAGIGTNGTYDVYPITWSAGGGFDPDIFDYADADTMSEYVRCSTGTAYQWDILIDSEQSDGIRYLTGLATQTGQWPVWRQGAVSWRACIDPTGIRCFQQPIIAAQITDSDIVQIGDHKWFSPDVNQVYSHSEITITNDWTSGARSVRGESSAINSSTVKSLPATPTNDREAGLIYRQGSPYVPGDMADADLDRLKGWDGYSHETLTLETKIRFCTLCAGDIVEISSDYIYGRDEAGSATYTSKRAMITGVDFSISNQSCVLQLAILPERYL